MAKCKAVVFDVDGTLAPEISWFALTRSLGASVDQHTQIYIDYREGKTDYSASKAQLIELWRSTGNANKAFFGRSFDALPLDPFAEKVIHIAGTDRIVCLITGSMDLYAQTIARKLGVQHWYANTTLHWDEYDNLHDMDYELNQGKKKLEQFTQFCEANGLSATDCLVLGDGENDTELFRACQRGVLIDTDSSRDIPAWKRINQLADFAQILCDY